MPATKRNTSVSKETSLELLASALGYIQGAGLAVRASNTKYGLAVVIEGAAIVEGLLVVQPPLPEMALPVMATEPDPAPVASNGTATTGNPPLSPSGRGAGGEV